MFNKTVAGVKNFLEKVFGEKEKKPNTTTLNDKLKELDDNRQERVEKLKEKHKKTIKALDGKMHMSKLGLADIILSEAIVTSKYKDSANVWTIGIGATRSEIKDLRNWDNNKHLSLEEIFKLFTDGIEKYSEGVRKALKVEVSQHMFDGLVSFAYNVGVGGMRKSSLIRAINRGVTDKAELRALLLRWTKITQNGRKVTSRGLVNRRNAEAEVMFHGKYKNKKMLGFVVPVSKKMRPMYSSKRRYSIDLNKYL